MCGNEFKLERRFDIAFTARLAQREKQIQQNYRPVIGVHKWFARRPGTVFRNLLLAEFDGDRPIEESYWHAHRMHGVIADPFMGGGTPLYEANRLGFSVVGTDINPVAYWIVRQSFASLDLDAFAEAAEDLASTLDDEIGALYDTTCQECGKQAPVKYFLWVKTLRCPECGESNDLFPGYVLAEDSRHPMQVLVCSDCGELNEFPWKPTSDSPGLCTACDGTVVATGIASRNRVQCQNCHFEFRYPPSDPPMPPSHRLWALEYCCLDCRPGHKGRFFKKPDETDLDKYRMAQERLRRNASRLPIPADEIPVGDETRRLHKWGYARYREMFNDRQLLGLGLLLERIVEWEEGEVRNALMIVFSDFLRYQNMLCRYDTYALKCQDIFSVHGFPVGLVQCENNLLGIPGVGAGAFRHFIEKYRRAKQYCRSPFESRFQGAKKKIIPIHGERIEAEFVDDFPAGASSAQAFLLPKTATSLSLEVDSLDGVFTDPPYFANVQYAERMDFCFVWLRQGLKARVVAFQAGTTRAAGELTGNQTLGRGLDAFTSGLSEVFCHYVSALKKGAPFVFTYHHNDPAAYVPLVVAMLDAGLDCTATLPAPAEMGASLHIARSKSSVLDSIFVCRKESPRLEESRLDEVLKKDSSALEAAGLKLSESDIRCLYAGHAARLAVNRLSTEWARDLPLSTKMSMATETLRCIGEATPLEKLLTDFQEWMRILRPSVTEAEAEEAQPRLFGPLRLSPSCGERRRPLFGSLV